MASDAISRWRFSLRTMLFFMLVCSILFGAWRVFGTSVAIGVSFLLFSAAPVLKLSGRLRRAYLISYSAVYGPFVVMAKYTLLFVSCFHCKETTWQVLPAGPGLIPADLVRRTLDLDRLTDIVWFGLGFLIAAAMVAAVSWVLATRHLWWQVLAVTTALAINSFGAIVVLALIRA